MGGLLELLLFLALLGLGVWALTTYIPMSQGISRLIQIVAVVAAVWIVLGAFGLLPSDVPVPRLR
jgi:hypothetical protein